VKSSLSDQGKFIGWIVLSTRRLEKPWGVRAKFERRLDKIPQQNAPYFVLLTGYYQYHYIKRDQTSGTCDADGGEEK
jgi:hypothetical protein